MPRRPNRDAHEWILAFFIHEIPTAPAYLAKTAAKGTGLQKNPPNPVPGGQQHRARAPEAPGRPAALRLTRGHFPLKFAKGKRSRGSRKENPRLWVDPNLGQDSSTTFFGGAPAF